MDRTRYLAITLALTLTAIATASAGEGRGADISLPRGSSLLDAARALQAFRGGAVVAEWPMKPRQSREALDRVEFSRALSQISREYDLYWEARPGSLALHRREYDPVEQLDLEEEEIRRVAVDLARLIKPFAPELPGNLQTVQENSFYHSLTEAQRSAMYGPKGLPFRALSIDQQKHWLAVNRAFGFDEVGRMVKPAARLFTRWKEWELDLRPRNDGRAWYLDAPPNPVQPHDDGLFLPYPPPGERARLPADLGAGEEITVPRPPLPSWLQHPANLRMGEYTLAELAKALETIGGGTIEIPKYATQRRLLVCAEKATLAQVVVAVTDLYGWEVLPVTGTRCRLGRPALPAARDVADLHAKIRRAIPPAAHLWFANHREFYWHRSATYVAGTDPLFQRLNQLEKEGTLRIRLSKLGPELQRRVANLVFDHAYEQATANFTRTPEARATLASPENGWFTLRRGLGEGALPELMFQAPYRDGKRTDMWGWAVGSSTLESGGK